MSQTVSPVLSDTAMTLPLSKPLIATSLAMMGVAVPRRLRRGTCCSTDHNFLPLCASRPCSRPSTERMTTTFSLIAGEDSSSEFTCERHNSRPVAPSSAIDGALAGAHHHHAKTRRRSRRQRHLEILDPDIVAGFERYRQHFALVRGGEHHAIVDRGPQSQAQHHLFLAAADPLAPTAS